MQKKGSELHTKKNNLQINARLSCLKIKKIQAKHKNNEIIEGNLQTNSNKQKYAH